MRIKMPNGVILESENDFVNKQRLKYGGVEVSNKRKVKIKKQSQTEEPDVECSTEVKEE